MVEELRGHRGRRTARNSKDHSTRSIVACPKRAMHDDYVRQRTEENPLTCWVARRASIKATANIVLSSIHENRQKVSHHFSWSRWVYLKRGAATPKTRSETRLQSGFRRGARARVLRTHRKSRLTPRRDRVAGLLHRTRGQSPSGRSPSGQCLIRGSFERVLALGALTGAGRFRRSPQHSKQLLDLECKSRHCT